MKTKLFMLFLIAVMPGVRTSAQDLKTILKDVATAVENKAAEKIAEKVDTLMITGSWQYVKPDIKLEAAEKKDLLATAGSELVAKKAEEHLVDVLTKIGIDEHTVFTFDSDSTYSMRTDKRTMQGTYSLNKETHEMTMTSRLRMQFTAIVEQSILKPNSLVIRFKAEKLMALAKYVTGTLAQKSTYKSAALMDKMLTNYDELTLGFELKKQ